MRSRRAQAAITAVAFLLGFLLVLQFRAQGTSSGLGNLSAQDLTTLIANLNTRNKQLDVEAAELETRLRDLRTSSTRRDQLAATIRDELTRVRRWAGLDSGMGRGVTISVSGPVSADAVNDLLNELRASGAEGIAIEDVRIVSGDVVAGPPDGLGVENTPLPDRFSISAIGNPEVLTASLTRIGGIIGRIEVAEPIVTIVVTPVGTINLPATTRALAPTYGKPRL